LGGIFHPAVLTGISKRPLGMKGHVNVVVTIPQIAFVLSVLPVVKQVIPDAIITQFYIRTVMVSDITGDS
jgi:hypothetical protein